MNEYDVIRAAFAHNRKDAELLLHETVRGILAEAKTALACRKSCPLSMPASPPAFRTRTPAQRPRRAPSWWRMPPPPSLHRIPLHRQNRLHRLLCLPEFPPKTCRRRAFRPPWPS